MPIKEAQQMADDQELVIIVDKKTIQKIN